MFRKNKIQVICPLSEAQIWRTIKPDLTLDEMLTVSRSRRFVEWYMRNKKLVNTIALLTPAAIFTMFRIAPEMVHTLLFATVEPIPVFAPATEAKGTVGEFFTGQGAILLHIMLVGFLTLVITTFLKFTGKGDLAPLVTFVGGGVILYEVLGLFKSIYHEVATFLEM